MPQPTHIGKYQIIDELGRGGFAVVYKARDPHLDRLMAVKVLRGAHAEQPSVVQRFLEEARKTVRLRHRGIVSIYDVGEASGAPYIAMEYLPGGTLADRLHGQPLPLDTAITIVEQIAGALDHAHKRKLVHRDVKPANILFDDEDNAVLVDFGLVKSLVESGLTIEGTSLGTPHYMAPEQADTAAEIDARADVYALGVVAYQMLAGRVPFEADTPLAVLHAHAHDIPPDPRVFNKALDEGVAAALLKSLNKSPAERYQTAGAFARALRQAEKATRRAAQTEATLETLYAQVQEEVKAGRWGVVAGLCVEIRNLDPNYRDVNALLSLAASLLAEEDQKRQQEREMGERHAAALELLEKQAYAEAIKALEEIEEQAPDYRDVQEKLAQARDELQRAQWYDEAIAHDEAGQLAEACRLYVQVLRGRLDYRDGDAVERLLNTTERLSSEKLTLDEAMVTVGRNKEWECLLFQSAHNKRSGKLSQATRRFIGKLCQDCAQSQDATLLLAALDNSDHHVRRFAAKALGELGGRFEVEQKIIVPKLMEVAAGDLDAGTRWRAVWALGAMRPSSSAREIIDLLCKFLVADEKNDAVRWRAAWALGEMKAKDALGTLISVALNKGEKESVRRAAIRALGAIQSPQAKKALSGLSSHGKGKLSEFAEWALQEVLIAPETLLDDQKYLSAATLARLKELTFEE